MTENNYGRCLSVKIGIITIYQTLHYNYTIYHSSISTQFITTIEIIRLTFKWLLKLSLYKNKMIHALKRFVATIYPSSTLQSLETISLLVQRLTQEQGSQNQKFMDEINNYLQIVQSNLYQVTKQQQWLLINCVIQSLKLNPEFFESKTSVINSIIDLLILVLSNTPHKLPTKWNQLGCSEDDAQNDPQLGDFDPPQTLFLHFKDIINELVNVIGAENFISKYCEKLQKQYEEQNNDWRSIYAILMIISQIGNKTRYGYMTPLIKITIDEAKNEEDRIREASGYAISQLSLGRKPLFQSQFFHQLFQIFFNRMNDPCERVIRSWVESMTNFVINWRQPTIVCRYLNESVQRLLTLAQFGKVKTKQKAILAMTAFNTIGCVFESQSIENIFEVCSQILNSFNAVNQHKQINNVAIELMTSLLQSQPFPLTQKFINLVVHKLFDVGDKLDPVYCIQGWNRVCKTKNKFFGWEDTYIKINEISMRYCISDKPEREENILNCIDNTVSCFKEDFHLFLEDTLMQLNTIMASNENNSCIFRRAYGTTCLVICKAKPKNLGEEWKSRVLPTIYSLFHKLQCKQGEIINLLFKDFKEVLNEYYMILNSAELEHLFGKFISARSNIIQKRGKLIQEATLLQNKLYGKMKNKDNQGQYKQKNMKQDYAQSLTQALLLIPSILTVILRAFKDNMQQFNNIVQTLFSHVTEILTQTQKQASVQKNQLAFYHLTYDFNYSIFVINGIIGVGEYKLLSSHWKYLEDILKKYCLNQFVQNQTILGLSSLIEKTPCNLLKPALIREWKKFLPNLREHMCSQQVLIGMSNLIKSHGGQFKEIDPLYGLWLKKLVTKPSFLNSSQISLLRTIMTENPEKIIKNSKSLQYLLKISIESVKMCQMDLHQKENRTMMRDIKTILEVMTASPCFQKNKLKIDKQYKAQYLHYLDILIETDFYTYD